MGYMDIAKADGARIPVGGARHDPNWWVKQKLRDEAAAKKKADAEAKKKK